jgi:hypothetical protein
MLRFWDFVRHRRKIWDLRRADHGQSFLVRFSSAEGAPLADGAIAQMPVHLYSTEAAQGGKLLFWILECALEALAKNNPTRRNEIIHRKQHLLACTMLNTSAMNGSSIASSAPESKILAKQAAKASWLAPILVWFLGALGAGLGARVIVDSIGLLLIIGGLLLGILSLLGIRKHGAQGILLPAVVGITINALLLVIFCTNFAAARARARSTSPQVITTGPSR